MSNLARKLKKAIELLEEIVEDLEPEETEADSEPDPPPPPDPDPPGGG